MAVMAQRIGFVGVGRMGANMARHLHDEGYTVSAVYDVQRASADSLADELECESAEEPSRDYGRIRHHHYGRHRRRLYARGLQRER